MYRYKNIKTLISERVGIEEYPKIINDRYMVGNLEIDTQHIEMKIDLISDEEIAIVEATINNRPMKRLGWKTPHDVMIEECS